MDKIHASLLTSFTKIAGKAAIPISIIVKMTNILS